MFFGGSVAGRNPSIMIKGVPIVVNSSVWANVRVSGWMIACSISPKIIDVPMMRAKKTDTCPRVSFFMGVIFELGLLLRFVLKWDGCLYV